MKIKFDYRYIIGIIISIIFVGFFLLFPNSVGRIIESLYDLVTSLIFYFGEIFGIDFGIGPTVVNLPKFPYFDIPFIDFDKYNPLIIIPDNLELFKIKFDEYWVIFWTWNNLKNYFYKIGDIIHDFSYVILIVVPLFLIFYILGKRYFNSNDNKIDSFSKPLIVYKRLENKIIRPVFLWIKELFIFFNCHYFLKFWIVLWLLYFNLISIGIEFIAFYLYFVVSFDFISIYTQFKKLNFDLWAIFNFMPKWIWFIVAVLVLDLICYKIAIKSLYHRERMNRGFINERGVVTVVYGVMGAGKTALITDMALSAEVQFRDQAYEIIIESDMMFPNFPWATLESYLKRCIDNHSMYDIWSVRRVIRNCRQSFAKYQFNELALKQYVKRGKKDPNLFSNFIFGYDFESYGLTYNNKLEIVDIWKVIEDYSCAYFIYTIQSSLIISNYSIRTDSLFMDNDNFPLWDSDFFSRDPRLLDSYSKHSHILDFDMLRLGKKMIQDNPTSNAFGFGVYVISEIDKERKNNLELKDVKSSSDECNQKNDMFNALLKMSRHAVVVANRVFIKLFADLQRPKSLGANCRELGEVVYIGGKKDMDLALPFCSPFWLFEAVYLLVSGSFFNMYRKYRFNRSDNTLMLYLYKNFVALMEHHYKRVYNVYGSTQLKLSVESGRMDGEYLDRKYYRQSKKIWAKRYETDCLSGIFEIRSMYNSMGISDFVEYADNMATSDELLLQNSHFQNEVNNVFIKNNNRRNNYE